jgi:biopolymer transport protein ExbD
LSIWDVFHADSLELERGLSTEAIRAALTGGVLRDDDLVRPAGTTVAWAPLVDFPELTAPAPAVALEVGRPALPQPELGRDEPPAVAEPPERIRAGRAESPSAGPPSSDFELRADRLDETPEPDSPAVSTSTAEPPPWLELGGDRDDVAFPVISDQPHDHEAIDAPPGSVAREPGREHSAPSAWVWPDQDDEPDEEAGAHHGEQAGVEFDEQIEILDDDESGLEILDEDGLSVPSPFSREASGGNGTSHVGLPVVPSRDWNEDRPPVEGGDDDDFTLSRRGPMTVEELDLAPMVDVAFQLVLFFMVTATTVLYKTLEIPKPTTDQAPGAVAQGHSRSVEDLQKDFVLVEIDTSGEVKIDRESVSASVDAIAERLRTARDKTGRKVMLLSADYATPHRHAVLAYDAAIEIGMGISIARPKPPQGPAPSVFPGAGRGAPAQPAGGGSSSTPTAPAAKPPESAAPAQDGAPF